MKNKEFEDIIKKVYLKEPLLKKSLFAFLGGGLLGVINQGIADIIRINSSISLQEAFPYSSLFIMIITTILTGLGIYNFLGQLFGAGLFIPITGFANAMVSSCMEGKDEGVIEGIGTRVFSLTGSVIAYGIFFASLMCIFRYIISIFGVAL